MDRTLKTNNTLNRSSRLGLQLSEYYQDHRSTLVFALVVMLVTTIPYFLGYFSQGDAWKFTGFVFGVEDGNSYIGKMLRGAQGDWLFRTPYTAVPQGGVFAFISYLILGKLTSSPGQHEQMVALFHIYRIIAGILSILAVNDFIAIFIVDKKLRLLGLLLACFGGGLGYVLVLLGRSVWLGTLPLEFYSPESFGFLTLFGLPHLSMARAFFFWGLVSYLNASAPNGGRTSGLLWLVMGIFQPLTIVLAWVVVGSHFLFVTGVQSWRKKQNSPSGDFYLRHWFYRIVWLIIIPSPLVIYTVLAFKIDPVVSAWTAQNLIPSPHPFHYLFAYGMMFPLMILGISKLFQKNKSALWLPISWILIFPILVYAPYGLQRRLAEGIWIAIIVLILVAIVNSNTKFQKWGPIYLLFSLPSTFIIFFGSILSVVNPSEPLFLIAAEVTAFQFLADHTEDGSVVLSGYETGNVLPAWAPVFVVIGHGPETAGIAELQPQVEGFYQQVSTDQDYVNWLEEIGVDYVFWGPVEKKLGGGDLTSVSYLKELYKIGEYEIFRFVKDYEE